MPNKKDDKKQDPISAEMGARVRREREARGWSQAELSKHLRAIDKKAPGAKAIGNYENWTAPTTA